MFKSDYDKAVAYAAYLTLKRQVDDKVELPPGFHCDVSGATITITLPPGSIVERDKGTNGNGTILKKATQNLYGYAFWALLIHKLKKFKQWNNVKHLVAEALIESIKFKSKNFKDEVQKKMPEVAREMEELQNNLNIPPRIEDTPRLFKETSLPATLTISRN